MRNVFSCRIFIAYLQSSMLKIGVFVIITTIYMQA